ncbi:MAG TPA: transposase, partial [Polyangiales bacterium]|nr:transposase [Polyangiales bacterium]
RGKTDKVTRMLVRKAFRYRVYPTAAQSRQLLTWESALRFLWNLAHEQRRQGLARAKNERRYYSAFDQINQLTELRAVLPWLADVPRNVCAQLLVELDKAWQRCFKKLACAPRWKRKGKDCLAVCEPHPKTWRLDGTRLRFPKLGNIRAVVHRALEGTPKTCTLRREGDQWFASIVCEIEIAVPAPRTEPTVALDRGVVNFVADSDGHIHEAPRFYQRTLKRLARTAHGLESQERLEEPGEGQSTCCATAPQGESPTRTYSSDSQRRLRQGPRHGGR